jgi:general secretion pathway protein H
MGRRRARLCSCDGFSLLELLVVVTIIAILAGAAVLSMGTVGADRELQREAERLQTVIDLLNEEAVLETRDYGLLFTAAGYRFYIYDYQTLRWLAPADDALLAQHELETPIQLALELEDREVELAQSFETLSEVEEPEPQVIVFASGEVTPFVAGFYRDLTGGRFMVDVEFDGTTEVSQDGFE